MEIKQSVQVRFDGRLPALLGLVDPGIAGGVLGLAVLVTLVFSARVAALVGLSVLVGLAGLPPTASSCTAAVGPAPVPVQVNRAAALISLVMRHIFPDKPPAGIPGPGRRRGPNVRPSI